MGLAGVIRIRTNVHRKIKPATDPTAARPLFMGEFTLCGILPKMIMDDRTPPFTIYVADAYTTRAPHERFNGLDTFEYFVKTSVGIRPFQQVAPNHMGECSVLNYFETFNSTK